MLFIITDRCRNCDYILYEHPQEKHPWDGQPQNGCKKFEPLDNLDYLEWKYEKLRRSR